MNESNHDSNPFNGQHSPTGFTGRTVNSVRGELAQAGRNTSALVSTSPFTHSKADMPTSKEFIAYQQTQQAKAETSQWFDHSTSAPVVSGNVHSDHDPEGFLAAHGFRATNAQGEEMALSPRQARGLVGRYLDSLARGGNESVSFRDDSLPPARATVYLRKR